MHGEIKKGVVNVFFFPLMSVADPNKAQLNPTLDTVNDFEVFSDGVSSGTFNTPPATAPAGSRWVKFTFDAVESVGSDVYFDAIDFADDEWIEQRFTFKVVDEFSSVEAGLARKAVINRLELSGDGTLVLFDDDGTTPLKTWAVKDITGGAVTVASGLPAKRPVAT